MSVTPMVNWPLVVAMLGDACGGILLAALTLLIAALHFRRRRPGGGRGNDEPGPWEPGPGGSGLKVHSRQRLRLAA